MFVYVSHICCKCFIWMFAYVCNGFQLFLQVFQMHISSVSSVFCLLQVLYLNVSKVDRVLHMGYAWEAGEGASGPRVGDVWAARAPCGRRKWDTKMDCIHRRPDASSTLVPLDLLLSIISSRSPCLRMVITPHQLSPPLDRVKGPGWLMICAVCYSGLKYAKND